MSHPPGCYSISSRKAAAAAKGPTTRLASDSPQRVVNGVPNAIGPLTAAGVAGADDGSAGAASGMINTAQQLGGTVGIAALVAITAASGDPLAERVTSALGGGTVLAVIALVVVIALIIPGERASRRGQPPPTPDSAGTGS